MSTEHHERAYWLSHLTMRTVEELYQSNAITLTEHEAYRCAFISGLRPLTPEVETLSKRIRVAYEARHRPTLPRTAQPWP